MAGVGTVTLSIDLELAWGNWDDLSPRRADLIDCLERPICDRLLAMLDAYDLPATWAIVAALLDPLRARGRPGPTAIWQAPEIVDAIRGAPARHDIGSQGGRHLYFDRVGASEARADLRYARAIHDLHDLPFRSFVFPRNLEAKHDFVREVGLKVFRGADRAWHQRLRARARPLGRLAHLVDAALPIAPEVVQPTVRHRLIDIPGSMLLIGRDGPRALVSHGAVAAKLRRGLDAAEATGGVFHLWFHPSNFYHRTDDQFAILSEFLGDVAERREAGRIDVRAMASFAS